MTERKNQCQVIIKNVINTFENLTFQKATGEDADEYTKCHTLCWQAAYKGIVSDDFLEGLTARYDERVENFRNCLTTSDSKNYCVMCDDEMIGFLVFGKSRDDDKPDYGEINGIYLRKEYWDKGFGKKILEFAMEELKQMGYDNIIIWTLEANQRARQFYKKNGFVIDGTTKEVEYGRNLKLVRYELSNK